ncbi:MAG TPA: hypothetical protein VLZ06_11460 [Solirubrobacteraceae bacterium]|nr:hypothetical protein [Solirubrobacteraceae bacterium]
MSSRSRKWAFGTAGALVVAGACCAAFVSGVLGEVLTIVLISGGLCAALLLLFLEVGLDEERDLEREQRLREARDKRTLQLRRRSRLPQRPRRPQ